MKSVSNIALAATLLVTATAGCTKIEPDEIGVRTVNFGDNEGIVQQDYEPGYHRYVWPLDTWHRFPSTVQRVQFHRHTQGRLRDASEHDPLQVTSADGDRVAVSAAVFFRIAENSAHRVLQDSGPGDRFRAVVSNLAQDAARVVFGRLGTEDFYDEDRRKAARDEALDLLKERIEPRGMELVDLLVESIEFEPNYENLIKEKKVADQRVELEKSKARAAEEKGKVDLIKVQTTAMLRKLEKQADATISQMELENNARIAALHAQAGHYATEKRADGDLYTNEKKAEGTRLLGQAEAEGTHRLSGAMDGEGSRNLVALEAVRNIHLGEITFPSIGYEWFNPIAMALRIGGGEALDDQQTTARAKMNHPPGIAGSAAQP